MAKPKQKSHFKVNRVEKLTLVIREKLKKLLIANLLLNQRDCRDISVKKVLVKMENNLALL